MSIDFANLQLQYKKYKDDIDANIQTVLNKLNYIMGEEVHELEKALEIFTGAKFAISCSSGTDALLLAKLE
jgi:UDP-2-acetamido-2-deoxy-ribo-hexuluronate aminotransferase